VEQPEDVHEPQNYGDHYYRIQDGLDRCLHRYKAIDEPKHNAYHDQDHYQLK
jgi:hypothetical protein